MAFVNRIRLPIKFTRPQFPEEKSVYTKADGSTKTLSVVIKKQYEGETDYMPEKWHQRLVIALGHDNITVEGDKYLGGIYKDGDYNINWQTFLDYPTAKAKLSVFVTPFNATNSNCMTCEDATQLSLVDDTFPAVLHHDTTYNIDVSTNDNICCYPAVFSIITFDSDFLVSATISQLGILTIVTKHLYMTTNGVDLVTYRVTCPNGGFDEAHVFGDLLGLIDPVCLAPTDLSVTAITTGGCTVSWLAPATPPNHYHWQVYAAGDPGTLLQSGDTAGLSVLITGLDPETEYIFYVRSQCDATDADGTASNYVSADFTTNPESDLCGEYKLIYSDPFGGLGAHTDGTYLDCNGNYVPVYVPNNITRVFCAMQTSPGVPVSINPGSATIDHGIDSNCS